MKHYFYVTTNKEYMWVELMYSVANGDKSMATISGRKSVTLVSPQLDIVVRQNYQG